jgi:DNA-binding transcriptional regulator GbsR (MarR family)
MTRTEAAHRLLALGPLTFKAFHEITGWPRSSAYAVLSQLARVGIVRRVSHRGTNHAYFFELSDESGARA